jgi:hypothetical protein
VPITLADETVSRHGRKMRGSCFLVPITAVMFLGGTLFLCLDVSDLVRRMQIILINNPAQSIQEKSGQADDSLKRLLWTGEMLFVFMVGIEVKQPDSACLR